MSSVCAHLNNGGPGGADFGRAGFVWAGVENPVWAATPIEILNSGGSNRNQTELIIMYQFKFAAICRTDKKNHVHFFSTIADTERDARRLLAGRARKFVLFFQARLPVAGGVA